MYYRITDNWPSQVLAQKTTRPTFRRQVTPTLRQLAPHKTNHPNLKITSSTSKTNHIPNLPAPPGSLRGEHARLITWWFSVRDPVQANFPAYFRLSPLLKHVTKEKSVALERNLC